MDRDIIPYIFAGELDKGGFGVVHLITTDNGPKLALKTVDLRRLPEDHRERAKDEAKILQRLNHRHIVHHVISYIIHPYMCIITEFCEAGDLDKVISRLGFTSGLPEKLLICWLMQSCEALYYMHTNNPVVVHRDLKPQSIFVTVTGDIRLGCFRLARNLMGPHDMAHTVVGTLLYMSPEMLAQQPYNSKTDIWSLGCVFYDITGKKGNDETGVMFLLVQVMGGRRIPLPDSYSEGWRNTITSMLCKDQKLRASAAHVLKSRVIQEFIQNPQKPLDIIADHARKNGRQVPNLVTDLSDVKCGFTPFEQDKILVKSEMLKNLKASLNEERMEGTAAQTVTQAVKQMKLNPAIAVAGMRSDSLAPFAATKGGNATSVNEGAVGGLAVDDETFFDYKDEPGRRVLLVIGKSGTGKSSTGNTILGSRCFKTSRGLKPQTREAQVCSNDEFEIIDTPDIPLNMSRKQAEEEVKSWLDKASAIPNAVLLTINADERYSHEDVEIFERLQDLLERRNICKNLVIVFTRGDLIDRSDLEQSLTHQGDPISIVLKAACGRYVIFDNNTNDAQKLIEQIKTLSEKIEL